VNFFAALFSWWHSQTYGTWVTTVFSGSYVGTDTNGNRYYQSKKGGARRWVVYSGLVEASRVPAEWHGWLHHTFDQPPTAAPFKLKAWEKEHRPNFTGTPDAYRPDGSLLAAGKRPRATGDYQAWEPK
jgi:NADH:ubiquinone oxidoreductase subunit